MGKGGGDQPVTIGYQYFLSMHLALCHGPVDSIEAIKAGNVAVAWRGLVNSNAEIVIDEPSLFGGKMKEGGIQGTVGVLMGADDQAPDEWLRGAYEGTPALPAYRGITSLLWRDIFYGSNTATPKPWSVLATRIPLKGQPFADINGEANPAYIIAECLTNTLWGLGYSLEDLNVASFHTAAKLLFDENFGLSVLWENSSSTEDFLNVILQHCNGVVYVDPRTGQFTFRLIRADYNVDTLFVVNETNIIELTEMARIGPTELVNQITVKWVDAVAGDWRSLTVHNPAVREVQKSIVAITREYAAVTNAELAKTLAMRDISIMSQPLATVKLVVNRSASALSIGDVIKWNWSDLGIEGMILRVLSIGYGLLDSGAITLECAEDIFGAHLVNYVTANGTEWVDPTPNPQTAPAQRSVNATYMDVLSRLQYEKSTIGELTPNRGFNILFAAQPAKMTTSYELWVAQNEGTYKYNKIGLFTPFAKVLGVVPPGNYSTFQIGNSISLDDIHKGQYAVCGKEWLSVDSVSLNPNGSVATIGCFRGVADTSPGYLYAEADIWFYDRGHSADFTDFENGTVARSKARTRSALGLLPLEFALESENVIDARWMRPYPPGNLRINSDRFPPFIRGDIQITWAHRHRILQDLFIVAQNESSISSPEPGTSYTIRIFSLAGDILRTIEGQINDDYLYTRAEADSDGAGTAFYVGIVAVKDGLASYGAAFTAVVYEGSTALVPMGFPDFGAYDPMVPVLADHIEITYIDVEGDQGEFSGQDAVITWADNHVALFTPPTKFSLAEQADWFHDYEVTITKNEVVRRVEYVSTPRYVYTYAKNIEDGLTRSFGVEVRVRDVYLSRSPARGALLANPAPTFISITFMAKPSSTSLLVRAITLDPALKYVNIYASKTSGFIPSEENLAYQGSDLIITVPTPGGGIWYIRVEGIDDFGTFGAIMSDEYTPDITPPSPPTNLTAEPMFRAVLLRWLNPPEVDFDHVEIWMGSSPSISDNASMIGTSTADMYIVANLPVSMEIRYFWVRAVDTSGNVSAFNAVAGTSSGTLQEATFMVALLEEQISESALSKDLAKRIEQIDLIAEATLINSLVSVEEISDRGVALANEVRARGQALTNEALARGTAIANEETIRISADSSLANSINILTAVSGSGFDTSLAWYFDTTEEDWSSIGATQAWEAGGITVRSTGANPQFISPQFISPDAEETSGEPDAEEISGEPDAEEISGELYLGAEEISGELYPTVKLRVTRLAGEGWAGSLFYETADHGFSTDHLKTVDVPAIFGIGDTAVVEFDMASLTAGDADWVTSFITRIRVDLGNTAADVFAIDWIAIGRNGPAASTAGLSREQKVRASADEANASSILSLAVQVNDEATGLPKTRADLVIEQEVRATADEATASSINGLSAQVNDMETGLPKTRADLVTEQSVRAAADEATASSIAMLTSQVDDPATGLSKTRADLVTEQAVRATADEATASSINGLSAQVNDTETGLPKTRADLVTEQTVRAAADEATASSIALLTSQVDDPATGLVKTRADLLLEQDVRAADTEATANQIATLITTINTDIVAALQTETSARVTADEAVVGQITTLQATVGNDLNVAIQAEADARVTANGLITAKYTVKIDAGGYVSGYGLMSEPNAFTGTALSSFAIRADQFSIGTPAIPGTDGGPTSPFMVTTTETTIDGTVLPPGVYIKNAFISKLTADKIDTRGLTIRDATGNVILGSGTPLAWSNIGAGKPTSLATLNAYDAQDLSNAVSAAATANTNATTAAIYANTAVATANSAFAAAGAPEWANLVNKPAFGNYAYLSSINSANISTYIQAAAIGEAYIANGAITSAKIGSAQIGTLKLKGASVTVPLTISSGLASGNGSMNRISYGKLYMDSPGVLYVHAISSQSYGQGMRSWRMELSATENSTGRVLFTAAQGESVESTITLALSDLVGVGWITIELRYYGQNSGVRINNSTIFAMGAKR